MTSLHILSTLASFALDIFKLIPYLSTIWNLTFLALTHLKCAFELLLHSQYSFSSDHLCNIPRIGIEELVRISQCTAENAGRQCAVCLSEVEGGEEIGELRCCHVFHLICLQRWVRHSSEHNTTCPLCRNSLAPRPSPPEEVSGVEVLVFKFCSFRSHDDEYDSWWLR